MSKENLDQFIQKVTDDEELQARIGEEIDTDAFITLGAEHGCEFSAEDLSENAELSDEQLDGVAGGLASAKTSEAKNSSYLASSKTSEVSLVVGGRKLVCYGADT